MMPTVEARQREALAYRARLYAPLPPAAPAPPPPTAATLRAAEATAHRLHARDRAARIRRGACPVCAERLCPRVGGRDVACVAG